MKTIRSAFFAFIAMFMLPFSSAWADTAYVKITDEDGSVFWDMIHGTINGTSIELGLTDENGEPNTVISYSAKGFLDLNEVWSERGGNGIHYQVTSIGEYSFYFCNRLTSVNIPSSVKSIGYRAFHDCSSLTSVTISYGVKEISGEAFFGCRSLISITIPQGLKTIGSRAFKNCISLSSISIPSSVTAIGEDAFISCYGLKSVEIDINTIDKWFHELNIETVTLGEQVTTIGNSAFYGCEYLTSINIPSSVTTIGNSAFHSCSNLASISLPEGLTSIGEYAFSCCSNIPSISIPSSVTSIGDDAFKNCSSLKNVEINTKNIETWFKGQKYIEAVTLGDNVNSIEMSAFQNCSGLTSITISPSVTTIGNNAFLYCSNLEKVNISSIAAWCRISFNNSTSNPLCYARRLYLNNQQVNECVIPSGVTSIGNYAFWNCSNLNSITIPSSVTSIGEDAFQGCLHLNEVNISDIASWCNISFMNSLSNPLGYAQNLCLNKQPINDLVIPSSVNKIGSYAFLNCSNLTSIIFPSSIKSIGDEAFSGCSNITDITSGITDVFVTGSNAFVGCENATLHIPSGTYIAYTGRSDWNRIIHIVESSAGFKMRVACNTRGNVVINGQTALTNMNEEIEVNQDVKNTFEFIPNEGCRLEQVTLNGLDVTLSVNKNKLTAMIPANSQMMVVFSRGNDVNGDGNVDISDVVSLVNFILAQ